jgi:hypothetical protein
MCQSEPHRVDLWGQKEIPVNPHQFPLERFEIHRQKWLYYCGNTDIGPSDEEKCND